MIPKAPRRSSHGFSLVELLVVIGIIAILVSVMFPYLRSALIKANTIKCAGHLRSIGTAMISFAGDNNGNLPLSDTGVVAYNAMGSTSKVYGWTQQLAPYIGADLTVFQCPDSSTSLASFNANYAYFSSTHAAESAGGTQGVNPVSLLKMHGMAQQIIAGDIAFPAAANLTSPTDDDKNDWNQDPAFNGGTAASPVTIPIHGGFSNILFADGHVESDRYFDPTSMTTVYTGVNPSNTYTNP